MAIKFPKFDENINPQIWEGASLVPQLAKNLPAMQETVDWFLGREDPVEEGIGYPLQDSWASLVAQTGKYLPAMPETWVWFLGWEDPLEEGMATHSSILPGESLWTEELVGYSPWDHKEMDGQDWATKHSTDLRILNSKQDKADSKQTGTS